MAASRTLFVFLLGGCTGSLPSPYEIHDLRVISIIAEPPEVAPGGTVALTAYFEAPDVADPNILAKWQMCPGVGSQEGDISCVGTSNVLTLQDGPPAAAIEPGVFATTFSYSVPADLLSNAGSLAQIYGYNDDMIVHGSDQNKSIDALKRLVVSNAKTPNSNPSLSGFTIDEGAGIAPDVFALERGTTYTFRPSYDPSSLEKYAIPDFNGNIQSFSEEASFVWSCAPSCTMDRGTTYSDQTMLLSLPADWNFGATLLVNVVMRDGRGGEAFYNQRFSVLPTATAH